MNQIYVGFDRDGTLESQENPMPVHLIKKFNQLRNKGIHLFIASGKGFDLLNNYVDEIDLKPDFICSENGGYICSCISERKVIYGDTKEAKIASDLLNNMALPPHEDEHKRSILTKKFGKHLNQANVAIRNEISKNNLDIDIYDYPEDGALDIIPTGVDKNNALDFIPQEAEIHFIGDSYNDLSLMCHERVTPHTMSNGKDDVKSLVNTKNGYIAQAAAGEGVSEILNKVFGI